MILLSAVATVAIAGALLRKHRPWAPWLLASLVVWGASGLGVEHLVARQDPLLHPARYGLKANTPDAEKLLEPPMDLTFANVTYDEGYISRRDYDRIVGALERSRRIGYGAAVPCGVLGAALAVAIASALRRRRRRRDEWAALDEVPQLVGATCSVCGEKVVTAHEATHCSDCREVLHNGCLADHACQTRPRPGPD